MPEYESWKQNLRGSASGWTIKYYKVCIFKFVTCNEKQLEHLLFYCLFSVRLLCLSHTDLSVFIGAGNKHIKGRETVFWKSRDSQVRFYLGR